MDARSRHEDLIRSSLSGALLRRRLRSQQPAVVRVRGRSMRPLVPEGARVRLRPVEDDEDLAGAMVAVDTGSYVAVHRVTSTARGTVRTQGIARDTPDPEWAATDIIGVACAVAGPGGWSIDSERGLRALAGLSMASRRVYRVYRVVRGLLGVKGAAGSAPSSGSAPAN